MKALVVTNMYPSEERPHWGAFVRSQVESLAALGVEPHVYEIQGWRTHAAYARALWEVPRVLEHVGADLVHAHYGLSGIAAWRVSGVPLVVSFCGDDLLGRPDGTGRITTASGRMVALSKMAAKRAEATIVKSAEMRRVIHDVPDVEVIPNGVDLEAFAPLPRAEARARLGWAESEPVLLFAGDPKEPRKNWRLAEETRTQLERRGLASRLVAVHGRPQPELALAMNGADVLLLPSFHEGSPNVVKEAMAVNLPVVAAPVGDCAERLAGVAPGAVVARDPAAFAAAAEAVLRAGARSNGRERVRPLELSAVARRVLAVYERALARPRT